MAKQPTDSNGGSKKLYNNWGRHLSWIFSKSGVIPLSIEHFLAMLPATLLVPLLVNNTMSASLGVEKITVIDSALVLLTSGLGTLVFWLFSKFRIVRIGENKAKLTFYNNKPIPAYLGSSFAYIAITIYLLESQSSKGIDPSMAYVYVGWAYFFSSLMLIVLSTLFYFVPGIDRFFSKYLPAAVIGPAISLIGLELSDTAIQDAGFKTPNGIDIPSVIVAMVTLTVIVLFSLIRRKFWKNAAIIIGMLAGYAVYVGINGFPALEGFNLLETSLPAFRFPLASPPPNWQGLLIAVIPATLVVFTENIGRITVINRMTEQSGDTRIFDADSVKTFGRALLSHGFASLSSALVGSVPNTIYAENIAVMGIYRNKKIRHDPSNFVNRITNPYSSAPYLVAAGMAIVFAFSGALQTVIQGIPKPVIGGMELFLFGVISAPGIQLLVDQRVNYNKVSNQIVTAAVLLTGISELSIEISWFELKGMSLGLIVGFILNLVVLFLKWLGILCDPLTIDEVTVSCLNALPRNESNAVTANVDVTAGHTSIAVSDINNVVSALEGYGEDAASEKWRDIVSHASEICLARADGTTVVHIFKRENSLCVHIRCDALNKDVVDSYLNDYTDAADKGVAQSNTTATGIEYLVIDLSRNIPLRKVETLVREITW